MAIIENGDDRTPSAPKHRQMLALLLLNANHVVTMDQFIEELWDYSPPPRAVAAVHTYIMQLRRGMHGSDFAAIPAGRLVTRDQGYLLHVGDDEFDLHAYEREVRAGRASLDAGYLDAGARRIRTAHDRWCGQALVDVPTGPLLRAAVAAIELDRTETTVRRIHAELQLGRHHELVAELSALVHKDPANEQLAGQLILALYRSGRQIDALATFHRLRQVLREELGAFPSQGIHQLVTDILVGDPRLEPPDVARPRQSLDAAV